MELWIPDFSKIFHGLYEIAHPAIVTTDVCLEKYVVVMSRFVGALLTLIVRSGLTSNAVSFGTLVIT